jgi:hypothetical protein
VNQIVKHAELVRQWNNPEFTIINQLTMGLGLGPVAGVSVAHDVAIFYWLL